MATSMAKVTPWISMAMKIPLTPSKKIKIGDFKVAVSSKGEGSVVFKKMPIITRAPIM